MKEKLFYFDFDQPFFTLSKICIDSKFWEMVKFLLGYKLEM